LIFLVQLLFLGNLRSAIVVSATIPFALFFAITLLVLRGESANLLSVGAIDFGLIVDATVLMVENVFRHLAEGEQGQIYAPAGIARAEGFTGRFRIIFRAAAEVNRAIFFSAAIIIAGFLPLFTMSGIEGHIFAPMAKTYGYAILGGLIATYTVSPALSAMLLPDTVSEVETIVVRGLRRLYTPTLDFVLQARQVAFGGAALVVVLAALALYSLGLEFLDPRDLAAVDLARRSQRLCQPHARGDQKLSRGRHCGFPERPAGRWDRCQRLLQRRVLRAAAPFRNLAQGGRQGGIDR
jgi:cobalt-zinc-cadmium resistance protein CzcA